MSILQKILHYSCKTLTPLNINIMNSYRQTCSENKILDIAKFMHKEVPIRLSKCYFELSVLPKELHHHINNIFNQYERSFEDITSFPIPNTYNDCSELSNVLMDIKERHNNIKMALGMGIKYWNTYNQKKSYDVNNTLDRFYMLHIGLRTIINQYIGIECNNEGIITECYPKDIIKSASNNALNICMHTYGDAPNIRIRGGDNIKIMYVPSHLYYIAFELCKNSLRATMEFSELKEIYPKDINIFIYEGGEDLIIRISDKGGGFPRKDIKNVFLYSYTTIKHQLSYHQPIIAGFGYGLPLSRLYARYFNGDLIVTPYDGIGTDNIVYINKFGNKEEMIY